MTEQYDPENPPEVPEGISRSTMRELPFSLVLTDPTLEDNPIIYVNRAFEKITGFHSNMANTPKRPIARLFAMPSGKNANARWTSSTTARTATNSSIDC